jgi:glycosyltransferase involved in cell wall biosynthesis
MTVMENPKVSIIMNCLNAEKYLGQALDSVYAQTFDNWEIIFWDNLSTDKSAEIAKSYSKKVRYFKSTETHSLGKARNLAITKAQGDFIAFLDCDDFWLPSKLEKQMNLFEKDSQVALVFSDVIFFDGKQDIYQLMRKYKPPQGMVFRELLTRFYIGFLTVIVRKSVMKGSEWFDERFNNIEDADLFFRIAYSNKLSYVDEPLAKWRIHNSSQTFQKYGLFAAERKLFLEKFADLHPDFNHEYAPEIKAYANKTTQFKVLGEWLNHRPTNARKILRESGLENKIRFSFYCLTFFPPSMFFALNKVRFKIMNNIG